MTETEPEQGAALVPSGQVVPELPQLPKKIAVPDIISPERTRPLVAVLGLNDALPGLSRGEGTALILDINNLYRRAAANKWSIDYAKLKSVLESRCDLRYAGAFSAIDRNNREAMRWAEFMEDKGYVLTSRPLKQWVNSAGEEISKGNMDVEITIAALTLSAGFAHVILGTCDGDFVPLVKELRKGNFRKVSVMGITNHEGTGMSRELIQEADHFYDLSEIREHVAYRSNRNA